MSGKDSEYHDIERYRKLLVGKKIKSIHFTSDTDEGLIVICEDGADLYFGFSGSEGTIAVGEKTK
jgi:hypothetical protein